MISDKKLQRGNAVYNRSGCKLYVQVYRNSTKNTPLQLTSSTDGPPAVISSSLRTKSVSWSLICKEHTVGRCMYNSAKLLCYIITVIVTKVWHIKITHRGIGRGVQLVWTSPIFKNLTLKYTLNFQFWNSSVDIALSLPPKNLNMKWSDLYWCITWAIVYMIPGTTEIWLWKWRAAVQ